MGSCASKSTKGSVNLKNSEIKQEIKSDDDYIMIPKPLVKMVEKLDELGKENKSLKNEIKEVEKLKRELEECKRVIANQNLLLLNRNVEPVAVQRLSRTCNPLMRKENFNLEKKYLNQAKRK